MVSGNIAAGINALPPSQQHSIVDVSLPFPVWYNPIFGYLPKNGEFDRLMPNWSSTARAYGEGPRLVGLDADGQLHRVSFDAQGSGPSAGGASVSLRSVRRSVPVREDCRHRSFSDHDARRHSGGSTDRARRALADPLGPGMHSFVLPVWSNSLRSVRVSGRGVKLVALKTGTVVLGDLEGSATIS